MALFEKLNDFARNIGDKTKDVIEITKLNSKISTEKSAIAEAQKKIGEHYYSMFVTGGQVDKEVLELCTAINNHNSVIAETQAEIERIRAEGEAAKTVASTTISKATDGITCTSCGASNLEGTKFCKECGSKMAPPVPAGLTCPSCGISNNPGTKFCCDCGTKLE